MEPLTTYEKWYGRNEPPVEVLRLKAGLFMLDYENGDLRYIRYRGRELIRRIYVAIRDHNWNTIPAEMSNLILEQSEDRFHIQFEAINRDGALRFRWHAFIDGYPDGTIEYEMRGLAESDFRYCRIGFCVLHPIEGIAGRPYRAITPQGEVAGILPELVEPQRIQGGFEIPLFPACSSLAIDTIYGVRIKTQFEGDLFEMEDQRNWTDGSFKTYSTPLSLGYPHQAHTGMVVSQKVTISSEFQQAVQPVELLGGEGDIHFKLEEATDQHLPKLGFGVSLPRVKHTEPAFDFLKKLKPDHLKVEVHFNDSEWEKELNHAILTASGIGSPLELALFLVNESPSELKKLSKLISGIAVARIIVYQENEASVGTTSSRWMKLVRDQLGGSLPGIPLLGGTNGNFAELNRQPADIQTMDGVSYTINPQVHASDERSLIEAIEGLGDTVRTARKYCGTLPISISSVTLKPPFNQAATEEVAAPDPNELPASVDPRQMSLFAAAWTVGSINSLASGGAESITYFETMGWRGLIESGDGSVLPVKFRSFPGMIFPVYYVFEFLADAKRGYLWKLEADHPLAAAGLCIKTRYKTFIVLVNLEPADNLVHVETVPDGLYLTWRLNQETMVIAATNPLSFLNSSESKHVVDQSLTLKLQPFETVMMKHDLI